jgi:hypothetical protein
LADFPENAARQGDSGNGFATIPADHKEFILRLFSAAAATASSERNLQMENVNLFTNIL